jgi:CheY-like chemotaxis protein
MERPMSDKNVLIVDDDKDLLFLLKEGLSAFSSAYNLFVASNALQAREILSEKTIHTVVTDVKMPGESGLDLLLFIRRSFPDLQVIIMTGYADINIKRSVLYGGAYAFMAKPFSLRVMGQKIIDSLEQSNKDAFWENLSLSDVLQFIGLGRYSSSVSVTAAENKGKIDIFKGDFIGANTDHSEAIPAVSEMLGWKNTDIELSHLKNKTPENASESILSVLMKATSKLEEQENNDTGKF